MLYFPFATLPRGAPPATIRIFSFPTSGLPLQKEFDPRESLFWAINRSSDAHIGAEYFSRGGSAPQVNFELGPVIRHLLILTLFQCPCPQHWQPSGESRRGRRCV